MKTVSLNLPEPVYEHLLCCADRQGRSPDEVASEAIGAYHPQQSQGSISLFDLPPLDLGAMLLYEGDDSLGEMLDDSRP